jgi:rubrerythrin
MSIKIFKCAGGEIILPNKNLVLVDAQDGGNLIVNPPREVWERSKLTPFELIHWSFLVAATGRAMLEVLPQLADGCINYWEAGNWALNEQAKPKRIFKTAKEYRRVHLHLLGRNPNSTNEAVKWGEAPMFPAFAERFKWAKRNKRLSADECGKIVQQVKINLLEIYGFRPNQIEKWTVCQNCGYPIVEEICPDCPQK